MIGLPPGQVFTLGPISIRVGSEPTSCFQERAFLRKGVLCWIDAPIGVFYN